VARVPADAKDHIVPLTCRHHSLDRRRVEARTSSAILGVPGRPPRASSTSGCASQNEPEISLNNNKKKNGKKRTNKKKHKREERKERSPASCGKRNRLLDDRGGPPGGGRQNWPRNMGFLSNPAAGKRRTGLRASQSVGTMLVPWGVAMAPKTLATALPASNWSPGSLANRELRAGQGAPTPEPAGRAHLFGFLREFTPREALALVGGCARPRPPLQHPPRLPKFCFCLFYSPLTSY